MNEVSHMFKAMKSDEEKWNTEESFICLFLVYQDMPESKEGCPV